MELLSRLARFSSHVMESTYWTWLTKPQYVSNHWYLLFSSFSCRLKYIPYSDTLRIVLPGFDLEMELTWDNMRWNSYLSDNQAEILDPADPDVARVLRVFARIVRALSDGLRLKRDCRVNANYNVPNRVLPEKNNEIVVPSRFGDKEITRRGRIDSLARFLGMKHNTEHLEGLDWEVMVVRSVEENAFYHGNGKVVIYDRVVDSRSSDEELARVLAHEVGHGVAMHMEGYPHKALWFFPLIPWPLGFWGPAIFIRLCELVLYCTRRDEFEADYIGLMLMASAGYDPRLVPQFYKKDDDEQYNFLLETTHPSGEQRAQMLSRDRVMDKAIKIYEQVQAGHEVPSII